MKRRSLVLMVGVLLAHVVFNLAPSCNPKQETWVPNGSVSAIVVSPVLDVVYLGGDFTAFSSPDGSQAMVRNRIAAINIKTGRLTAFNPGADSTIKALALSPDGYTIYVGGAFTNIGGQNRNRIASLSAATGQATTWNPNADKRVNALAVSSDGFLVCAGGTFTNIGGQARNYIAAINADTGSATGWNPNANGEVDALAVSPTGSPIYAGGLFTNIGGQNRNRIAAINSSTGQATAWNPNANSSVFTLAISPDGLLVYAGGVFTNIGGQTRNRIAAINSSTDQATAWNPNALGYVVSLVVSPTGAVVYAGGLFTNIGGQNRNRIAAIDAAGNGTATGWDPNANDEVWHLGISPDGASVFAGGIFTTIGGNARPRFAQFDPLLGGQWFMPAGAVRKGSVPFDTYILIANPGNQTATPTVYFKGSSTSIGNTNLTMGPRSRQTVKIGDFVAYTHPETAEVSTMVNSTVPVMCERAMYWPGGSWTAWTGGHGTIGINDPASEWNLPEGATHLFEQYIHVFNPCSNKVRVEATFMNEAGFTWQTDAWLEGERNWTIFVNNVTGGSQNQVSTRVRSLEGWVAVDRTMYWPKGGPAAWRGGHSSRGISRPSTIWYLAEGANHQFDHFVLVSNPSTTQTANVLLTIMDQDGNTASTMQPVGPQRRYTLKVNDVPGWGNKSQVSTTVESTNFVPIFAERAMYWPKGGPAVWRGGHNSIGSPEPAPRWHLPEGANHIFDHYVLVANPSETQTAEVTFTFMDQNGATATHFRSVEPKSRYTVKVNDIPEWGNKSQVSTTVEGNIPVLAERAMYWPKGGPSVWVDGHATVGIAE